MNECAYRLAGVHTALRGRRECVNTRAYHFVGRTGAREQVRFPFGRCGYGEERARVTGCAYHLAWIHGKAGASERVRLQFGRRLYCATGELTIS